MPPPAIPSPRESGFTSSTAVPLYWVRYGDASAPTLVVLHGGPGADHRYLLPQMLELARDYELVFYDQRGGGRSPSDDRSPISWRTHVEDLDRLVDELGLTPLSLVGYSWGGLLAELLAIETAAGRAKAGPVRLALIDPAPVNRAYREQFEREFARRQADASIVKRRTELAESDLRTRDPEVYRQRAFELSVSGYFAEPSAARDLTPFRIVGRVQQSVWESLGDYNLLNPGQLDTVRVPTLITHGREDPIPIASSEATARAMGAGLVTIDRCGHVPFVERPAALFAAMRRFLTATQ